MADNHQIVQVVTGIKTYDSMLLSTASTVRNAKTGGGLRFTLNMKSLRIVDTQLRTVRLQQENVSGPVVDRTTTVDAGEKDSPDTEGETLFFPVNSYDPNEFEDPSLIGEIRAEVAEIWQFIVNGVFTQAKSLKSVVTEAYDSFRDIELVNDVAERFGIEMDIFETDTDRASVIKRLLSDE